MSNKSENLNSAKSLLSGKIIYVEPNDINYYTKEDSTEYNKDYEKNHKVAPVTPQYQDMCITFDLVATVYPRTSAGGNKPKATEHTISFSSKDEFSTQSYIEGTNYDNQKLLTTYYTRREFGEYFSDKQVVEGLGVNSVEISFESWYTPVVTINFTDIRGHALLGHEEAIRNNKKGVITSENVFGAFFTLPYPVFHMYMKGFFGKPITLHLCCNSINETYDNQGNYKCTASFIGYQYSLLTDIPFRELMAAPYCNYVGRKYWADHWEDEKWKLSDGTRPPKLYDLFQAVNSAMQQSNDDSTVGYLNGEGENLKAELECLQSITSALNKFTTGQNSWFFDTVGDDNHLFKFYSSNNADGLEGGYKLSDEDKKCVDVFKNACDTYLSKFNDSDSINGTINNLKGYFEPIYNNGNYYYKLYHFGFKLNDDNSRVKRYWVDDEGNFYDYVNNSIGDKNKTIPCGGDVYVYDKEGREIGKHLYTLNDSKNVLRFSYHKATNRGEKVFASITDVNVLKTITVGQGDYRRVFGDEALKEIEFYNNLIESSEKRSVKSPNNPKLYEYDFSSERGHNGFIGKHLNGSSNLYVYGVFIELKQAIKKINNRIDDINNIIADKAKEFELKKKADIYNAIGFKPYIGNYMKIIMCHLETYIHMITHCAEEANSSKLLRSKNISANDGVWVNVAKDILQNNGLPPFPNVTKEQETNNETGEGGQRKSVASWLGALDNENGDLFSETRLVNSLIDGLVYTRLKSDSNKGGNKSDEVVSYGFYPIVPSDYLSSKNPFEDVVSLVDSNPQSFYGYVGLRLAQLACCKDLFEDGFTYKCYEDIGKLDALNWIIAFGGVKVTYDVLKSLFTDTFTEDLKRNLLAQTEGYTSYEWQRTDNKQRHSMYEELDDNTYSYDYIKAEDKKYVVPSRMKRFGDYFNNSSDSIVTRNIIDDDYKVSFTETNDEIDKAKGWLGDFYLSFGNDNEEKFVVNENAFNVLTAATDARTIDSILNLYSDYYQHKQLPTAPLDKTNVNYNVSNYWGMFFNDLYKYKETWYEPKDNFDFMFFLNSFQNEDNFTVPRGTQVNTSPQMVELSKWKDLGEGIKNTQKFYDVYISPVMKKTDVTYWLTGGNFSIKDNIYSWLIHSLPTSFTYTTYSSEGLKFDKDISYCSRKTGVQYQDFNQNITSIEHNEKIWNEKPWAIKMICNGKDYEDLNDIYVPKISCNTFYNNNSENFYIKTNIFLHPEYYSQSLSIVNQNAPSGKKRGDFEYDNMLRRIRCSFFLMSLDFDLLDINSLREINVMPIGVVLKFAAYLYYRKNIYGLTSWEYYDNIYKGVSEYNPISNYDNINKSFSFVKKDVNTNQFTIKEDDELKNVLDNISPNIYSFLMNMFYDYVEKDFRYISGVCEVRGWVKTNKDEIYQELLTNSTYKPSKEGLNELLKNSADFIQAYSHIFYHKDIDAYDGMFDASFKDLQDLLKKLYFERCIVTCSIPKPMGPHSKSVDGIDYYCYDNSIIIKPNNIESYTKSLINTIKEVYDKVDESGNLTNLDGDTDGIKGGEEDAIKISIYSQLSHIYNSWLIPTNSSEENSDVYNVENFYAKNFYFMTSAYENVYDKLVVNMEKAIKAYTGSEKEFSLWNYISHLISDHDMTIHTVPNFIMFDPKESTKNCETMLNVFKPYSYMDLSRNIYDENDNTNMSNYHYSNKFVSVVRPLNCEMISPPSLEDGYERDGFDISDENETDLSEIFQYEMLNSTEFRNADMKANANSYWNGVVPAFGVTMGRQNNHLFKQVDLNMNKPSVTEVSARNLQDIVYSTGNGERGVYFQGQDIFKVFRSYAYECTVTMMGNAQIQPLMYFQLNNIPMWSGAYIIYNVKHSIEPGNMTTIFNGQRVSRRKPYLNQSYFNDAKYYDVADASTILNGKNGSGKLKIGNQSEYVINNNIGLENIDGSFVNTNSSKRPFDDKNNYSEERIFNTCHNSNGERVNIYSSVGEAFDKLYENVVLKIEKNVKDGIIGNESNGRVQITSVYRKEHNGKGKYTSDHGPRGESETKLSDDPFGSAMDLRVGTKGNVLFSEVMPYLYYFLMNSTNRNSLRQMIIELKENTPVIGDGTKVHTLHISLKDNPNGEGNRRRHPCPIYIGVGSEAVRMIDDDFGTIMNVPISLYKTILSVLNLNENKNETAVKEIYSMVSYLPFMKEIFAKGSGNRSSIVIERLQTVIDKFEKK